MLIALLLGSAFFMFGGDDSPRLDEIRQRVEEHVVDKARKEAALKTLGELEKAVKPLLRDRKEIIEELVELFGDATVSRRAMDTLAIKLDIVEARIQDQLLGYRGKLKQSIEREEWGLVFPAPLE